ncbi:D-alanyl-D-alanine carboxypeptidase/D-alanyl-D-alanine-endopeptidase [Allosaccharopolyspora coralli]|uniref:D-alanyl-D-alanine carboxypeptidase/D-alanyl-D-alanine-endopeptidase n=1 Tax=Allosaccharopolyspora coralli TaxID=2665642 RepID=A0A5Q3Q8B9_9PSEU|nr:D-alanyl-D-alanine carboxypeptidase/D-alanyl-D-alanine-endopeptidase [Allosaccharopolyspora coralli]QGK70808.1 D-alanyl-D-alanine carboxypeptidase/D-alanyl-D-alanine-endopeptidase [Allosaccharopolyspora coralli]
MRRRWALVLSSVATLVVVGGVPTTAAPSGPDSLRADLDRILSDPRLAASHAGVVVRDTETGELLYSREGKARATPASNAKLVTSAAALETLGPDFRFGTEVRAAGEQDGGVLNGDLFLRGEGDPTMRAEEYDALAAQVAESGIQEIRGDLVADDSWFDDVPLGTGWAWDDEPYYYAAPVSALTVAPNEDFDAGTAIVRVSPAVEGAAPGVELVPATGVLEVDNRATTGPPGSDADLTVEREHATNRVVVTGSVPAGGEAVEEFASVPDPTAYAADVFARALAAHGVEVSGVGEGTTPEGASVVASRESIPLSELLVPFMKLSNNGHAEVLTKAMGRAERGEGSWSAGTDVIAARLADFGVDPEQVRFVDGSGLSTMDVVAPRDLATVLTEARKRPWFDAWYRSLPVAGVPERFVGGTLRNRMRDTPAENNVHAKTGSLTGVTSLSGYVTARNGHQLVFSVLFNDFVSPSPQDLEDAVAVRLAEYDGADDQSRPAVRLRSVLPQDDPRTEVDESQLECSWVKAC